ncbi:hypothetical protein V6L77_02345 [Pannonibacter sp. Pt2-lr]
MAECKIEAALVDWAKRVLLQLEQVNVAGPVVVIGPLAAKIGLQEPGILGAAIDQDDAARLKKNSIRRMSADIGMRSALAMEKPLMLAVVANCEGPSR